MNQEMNKEKDPDMLDEYDFSNGVRGKYVDRLAKGSNVIVLDPDVAEIFRDSESVNQACELWLRSSETRSRKPSRKDFHGTPNKRRCSAGFVIIRVISSIVMPRQNLLKITRSFAIAWQRSTPSPEKFS
jgi:hypothetical protein